MEGLFDFLKSPKSNPPPPSRGSVRLLKDSNVQTPPVRGSFGNLKPPHPAGSSRPDLPMARALHAVTYTLDGGNTLAPTF